MRTLKSLLAPLILGTILANPVLAQGGEPVPLKNNLTGRLEEFAASIYVRQPSPISEAERAHHGLLALEAVGRTKEAEMRAQGANVKFHHAALIPGRLEGKGEGKKNSWTGVRHNEFRGTSHGHLYFTVD